VGVQLPSASPWQNVCPLGGASETILSIQHTPSIQQSPNSIYMASCDFLFHELNKTFEGRKQCNTKYDSEAFSDSTLCLLNMI
jgi:hypothetical protein